VAQARKKAGLNEPAVKFHDLRHACATNLARAGHSAMVIKAVLRHAGLSTSRIYIDAVSDDEMRAAMKGVSESGGARRQLRVVEPEQMAS
jgi:integrase